MPPLSGRTRGCFDPDAESRGLCCHRDRGSWIFKNECALRRSSRFEYGSIFIIWGRKREEKERRRRRRKDVDRSLTQSSSMLFLFQCRLFLFLHVSFPETKKYEKQQERDQAMHVADFAARTGVPFYAWRTVSKISTQHLRGPRCLF